MEENVTFDKCAKLMALMNRHALDVEFIKHGYSLLRDSTPDELEVLETEIGSFKELIEKSQSVSSLEKIEKDNCLTKNKTVRVYVDGCFDLMHTGHYNSIRQSKKFGDVLVCGVNSDVEIEAVKGPTVFKDSERCYIIDACKWVDEVAPETIYSPTLELLDQLNCEFLAHGDDIALNADGVDATAILKNAGRFRVFKRTRGVSTTDITSKILQINDFEHDINQDTQTNEYPENSPHSLPDTLGPFNANPNFLASAKRIANFANTKEPLESDKIVYVDGSFDVCHPGHIEQLKKAKQLGDFLIVGIHEDQTVNQYLGSRFPLNTLHERVLNILACKYVDDVIIGAPFKVTERLLLDLNVSVVVKSLDVTQGLLNADALALDPYEVPAQLEMLTQVDVECPITVSEIIRRVQSNKEAIEKKVAKYAARQNEYESKASYTLEL